MGTRRESHTERVEALARRLMRDYGFSYGEAKREAVANLAWERKGKKK